MARMIRLLNRANSASPVVSPLSYEEGDVELTSYASQSRSPGQVSLAPGAAANSPQMGPMPQTTNPIPTNRPPPGFNSATSGPGGMGRGKDESEEIGMWLEGAEAPDVRPNDYLVSPDNAAVNADRRTDIIRMDVNLGAVAANSPETIYDFDPVDPDMAPPSWFNSDDTERDGQGELLGMDGDYPGGMAVGVDQETFEEEVDQNDQNFVPDTTPDAGDSAEETAVKTERNERRRMRRNLSSVTTLYTPRGGSREGRTGRLV